LTAVLSFVLGVSAALSWGTADFIGGTESRRVPVLSVVLWSQLTGTVGVFLLLAVRRPELEVSGVLWGTSAGLLGGAALLLFYRALALGPMSLVAPLSATGAAVPVLVDLARGNVPGVVTGLGMVVAFVGVILVSRSPERAPVGSPVEEPGGPAERLPLLLALLAAVGFGLFLVLLDAGTRSSGVSPLWVIGGTRIGSVLLLSGLVAARPRLGRWPGRRLLPIATVGVLDVTASAFITYAITRGDLSVVAILASQFPAVTVILARFLHLERMSRPQAVGVALALAGVTLLAAG
jgi:drug/metabolite transporter (DMT)-like permease